MMHRARLPLAVAALVFLVACQSDNLTQAPAQPLYAVSDGAHDGNPDFFFLPPMFRDPSNDPDFDAGAFNANLRPVVEICQLGDLVDDARSCIAGPPVRRFAGSEISVSAADQQYHVNWNTTESNLITDQFYRITVLVGGAELGFADVDPVGTGKELKNVQTGEYIGLVDGRTLPIKFRIENGALCEGSACAATTVTLPEGGSVELEAEGEVFRFDVEAGTEGTFGGQTVTEVTFNIEPCDGIDVDLRTFGECLRVTTYFDAAGGSAELQLNNPVLISMCILDPGLPEGQEEFITLHQQDGQLIRALPHAAPNCGAVGARSPEAQSFAARSWRWIRDLAVGLVTPRQLYAKARTVVFDVGGGGESDILGARCNSDATAMRIAMVECGGAAVAPLLAATATTAAAKTVSDFQFALPAKMDYVNSDDASRSAPAGTVLPTAVRVTDWNGGFVQGATVKFTDGNGVEIGSAISNDQGVAQVSWPIEEGPNTLVASGRGIAAQNNYPDATVTPFMPDIFSTDAQAPVVLRTGAVPFAATGVTATALIDCQTTGATGGDQLDRGFYIPTYPGTSLGRVELSFSADAAGDFTISLTARANTYDGPVIGTATAAVTLPANRNTFVQGTFDFSSAVFAPGSAVTFALAQVSGPSTLVFYEVPSLGNEGCPVVQTNGTEAPLSTFRRNGVEVRVFESAGPVLDQQNLLDGSLGGQGIGRFSDINEDPDPDGTSFDFQDAQTFTAGTSGQLTHIKVPLANLQGATTGVTMEIVAVNVDGVPDEASSLGEVTIPATAIPTDPASRFDPAAWPSFDLTSLEIQVTAGQQLAFIVRSLSTVPYLFNPESTSGYANGVGYRRNRALTPGWSSFGQDFGFQTFVISN